MSKRSFTARSIAVVCVLAFCASIVSAQQEEPPEDWEKYADSLPFPTDPITIPSWRRTDGPHVRAAFREVVAGPNQATVRILSDNKRAALGAIVDADGWIMTKASSLKGTILCRLADGRQLEAQLIGSSREYDVALLKVDAKGLPTLSITEHNVPEVGSWLVTVGTGRDPIAVGVLSVPPREIPHRPGILGVLLDDSSGNAKVVKVYPKSGADQAGIKADDVIVAVNRIATPSRDDLIRTVREFSPEDMVKLEIQREGTKIELDAVLTGVLSIRPPTREEFQNQLGSGLSHRRFGFPDAFQHDTVVSPTDCGGPLVSIDGEVVGLNIARAGRTETYALTTETLAELFDKLRPSESPIVE